MNNTRKFGFYFAATWVCSVGAITQVEAVPVSTAPFVLQGNTVTTPNAAGPYANATFQDAANPYNVTISPATGQSVTLSNSDTIINIGTGSTLAIDANSTLSETTIFSNVVDLGSGTVTNAGTVSSGQDGILISGDGTVINSGSITGSNSNGIEIDGAGTVTNTSTGSISTNTRGIDIFGDGTVTNDGSILAGRTGVQIGGAGNVTNSGSVTGTTGNGLELDGTGASTVTNTVTGTISGQGGNGINLNNDINPNDTATVVNAGSVTGAFDGVNSNGNAVLTNSGTITGQGNFGQDAGVVISNTGTVTNTGTISDTAVQGVGLLINGVGTVSNATSGNITGGENGIQIGTTGTIANAGTITGTTNDGIFLGETGTVNNTGSINGVNGIAIAFSGTVNNALGGTITGSIYGIRLGDIGTVTNSGSITGTGDDGIYIGGGGDVTLVNGSVSGGVNAVETNAGTGSPVSTVTVIGRTSLNGGLVEDYGTGTVVLDLAGLTPGEAAALRAQAGDTSGSITVGNNTYSWTNLTLIDNSVSLEESVDRGLRDIATKIDNNGQALSSAFDPFYVAAASNPENALNSLVGRQFDDAFLQIGLSNATAFSELADNRAFNLRQGASGLDFSGLSVSPSTMIASLGDTQNILGHLGSSVFGGTTMNDSKEAQTSVATANSPRWGAWASGTVTFADESGTATNPGYNATSGSPTIGIDYRICPDLVLGALFNYTTGNVNFGDGSNLDTDTYLGGLYADWAHGPWFINALAAYGQSSYDQTRTTLIGSQATASPGGDEELATLSGGYDFKINGWVISPEIGLQYTHLSKDAYSETGAGAFNLNVGDQDVNSLRTKLGFHAAHSFTWSSIKFTPEMNATWYHECLDNTEGVSNSLPGAPALGSFVVDTNPQGRDFAVVGAGLSAAPSDWHGNVSFFVNYDAQVGQSEFLAHTVDGGVRIGF